MKSLKKSFTQYILCITILTSTLHNLHSPICALYSLLYTLHSTLQTKNFKIYFVSSTLLYNSTQCNLQTICYTLYFVLQSTQYAAHSRFFLFALYNQHSKLKTQQSTICTITSIFYISHLTLNTPHYIHRHRQRQIFL